MDEHKPDLNKILTNPYAFKTEPKEAEDSLTRSLARMARFFKAEIQGPGEVEAAWNRYQEANGRDGILRLAFSIDHVLGVQGDLEAVGTCEKDHDLGRLGSIQILLHIGLIELVEGITHVNFAAWVMEQTRGDDPQLPDSVKAKDIRRYLGRLKEKYEAKYGAARRLATALANGLDHGEKSRLLLAYTFSKPYRLGEAMSPSDRKHLHCRRREQDWEKARKKDGKSMPYPGDGFCTLFCSRPGPDEIRLLLPQLAKKYLYLMRNQLVHAASAVMMAVTDTKDLPKPLSHTLSDAFFTDAKHLVSYQVSLSVSEVIGILRHCMWNRFRGASP